MIISDSRVRLGRSDELGARWLRIRRDTTTLAASALRNTLRVFFRAVSDRRRETSHDEWNKDIDWEQRLSELWASFDDQSEAQFLSRMEQLVGELPADNAVGIFERAGSLDSTGHSDLAVPLYRRALEPGLPGQRRRMAVIQTASSLRNIGPRIGERRFADGRAPARVR
jgi:hypothetical protein